MTKNNFLYLNSREINKPIYRVIPVYRLIEMFNTGLNVLSRPRLWDDPFENFILRSPGVLSDRTIVSFAMRDSLYGQCWTFQRESDAMWRIYSQNKDGVKIRTTIKKLFHSLYNTIPESERALSCFIGKVRYFNQANIRNHLAINLESTGRCIVETLLIKRKAFSHEKEVRLIYYANERKIRSEIFQYKIDPYSLIEQIVFDSRLHKELYEIYRDHIKRLNFLGPIYQSGLYKAPENILVKVP